MRKHIIKHGPQAPTELIKAAVKMERAIRQLKKQKRVLRRFLLRYPVDAGWLSPHRKEVQP